MNATLEKDAEQLFEENKKLVFSFVNKKVSRKSEYFDDALQESCIAFIESVETFDPIKRPGVDFAVHAWIRMNWRLLEFFRKGKATGIASKTAKKYNIREVSWDALNNAGEGLLPNTSDKATSTLSLLRHERWKKFYDVLKKFKYKFKRTEWEAFIWYYVLEEPPFKYKNESPTYEEIGNYLNRSRELIRKNINTATKIVKQTPELLAALEEFKETIEDFNN